MNFLMTQVSAHPDMMLYVGMIQSLIIDYPLVGATPTLGGSASH